MRAAGVLLALALAGLLAYQWAGWSPGADLVARLRSPAPPPGEPGPAPSPPPPRTLPPVERFAVVTERPLFNPDRRPPEPPEREPEPKAATKRPPLSLAGIVAAGDAFRVHARSPQGEPVRLTEGDEYQGWRVAEIGPERLVLVQDERREVYNLRPPRAGGAREAP